MTIITQNQPQLTSQLAKSKDSTPLPVTEIVLEVRKSILIVIAHYKSREVASHGLLSLRYDGSIDWTDTDASELLTSLFSRFKQMIGQGLNVYLAYPNSSIVWSKYGGDAIEYLPDRVVIPVDLCDFVLGGER
jgi:hypothetical protein